MAAETQGVAPAMPMAFAPAELPLPQGFRFHPTDQDLVNYYLRRKILLDVDGFIPEVDLYKYDPWELADKSFSPSRNDDPDDDEGPKVEEWYLFGPRGRKYANGPRMNRATPTGFWKSTGKDRPVLRQRAIIGYKKTLVYHLGRAPSGKRTNWVMHEYRLHNDDDMTAVQDTCSLCRVFKKKAVTPPLDVPGGADANKEEMKSVLDGTDADKDLMQPGAEADKDVMKSVLGGAGVVDDACYSSINANMEDYLMPFVDDGGGANMKDYLMQSVDDGGYANMEDMETTPMQFDPSGAAANKDDALMQSMPSGAAVDTESAPLQFVPNVAAADEEGASMHCEPNVAATESEGASKLFEPRVAAADNELFKFSEDELQRFLDDEAADLEVARVDDGAAGLKLVSGGTEGGGQEEDEE